MQQQQLSTTKQQARLVIEERKQRLLTARQAYRQRAREQETELQARDMQAVADLASVSPLHVAEEERLLELKSYDILDQSRGDARFQRITQLAATLFNTDRSVVTLVDRHRQYYAASSEVELNGISTPRNRQICPQIVGRNLDIFMVDDASKHPLLCNVPFVAGPPHVRFYAGAAIRSNGMPVGVLSISDSKPRPELLTTEQQQILRNLADIVHTEMELFRANAHTERSELCHRALSKMSHELNVSLDVHGALEMLIVTLLEQFDNKIDSAAVWRVIHTDDHTASTELTNTFDFNNNVAEIDLSCIMTQLCGSGSGGETKEYIAITDIGSAPGLQSGLFSAVRLSDRIQYVIGLFTKEERIRWAKYHWDALVSATQTVQAVLERRLWSKLLRAEHTKVNALLANILPDHVIDRLKSGVYSGPIVDYVENCSVCFIDLCNFTPITGSLSPPALVAFLGMIFGRIDDLIAKYDVLKIKTIGDAVFVGSGIRKHHDDHAITLTSFALDVLDMLQSDDIQRASPLPVHARASIHSGPVIAGVIGESKTCYDLFGDTVNIAARMEKLAAQDSVLLSEATVNQLPNNHSFQLIRQGPTYLKGKAAPVDAYTIHLHSTRKTGSG